MSIVHQIADQILSMRLSANRHSDESLLPAEIVFGPGYRAAFLQGLDLDTQKEMGFTGRHPKSEWTHFLGVPHRIDEDLGGWKVVSRASAVGDEQ